MELIIYKKFNRIDKNGIVYIEIMISKISFN